MVVDQRTGARRGAGGGRGGPSDEEAARRSAWRSERNQKLELLEKSFGYEYAEDDVTVGWLVNFSSSSVSVNGRTVSAVKCYFIAEDGTNFKAVVHFQPYFYVYARSARDLPEISNTLQKLFRDQIERIEVCQKEDLDLKNHLSGKRRHCLRIVCLNVQNLMEVRNYVKPYSLRDTKSSGDAAFSVVDGRKSLNVEALNEIESIREFDVPYHERFAIDTGTRCGLWYEVHTANGVSTLRQRKDLIRWAQPTICAFDIETTKLPLRFPNAEYDQVFMISYMINGKGFLIINREVVGSDIDDFEYSPKKDIGGTFAILNEADELATLWYFINHMKRVKPHIYVTYNGDFFDWPFIEKRAAIHGINLYDELGFWTNTRSGECRSHFAVHMDAFYWVKRDSYLPQGSQGLKAVTKAKLGYNPVEVDPEDMVKFAFEHPQRMASYSVSDAVATYFLYMKYVHPFIFSLGTIIPMSPDEVLRKGSGTLCESLLMVQAYDGNIIAPNKFESQHEKFSDGRLLESETYIGGHVEALESGVFRADIETPFNNDPQAYQALIDRLDVDLRYRIVEEAGVSMDDLTDYDEVKQQIVAKLAYLRDNPKCKQTPLIYHLDVAAMYPNIILTNRLQPCSTVTEEDCAACDFNTPDKRCLRKMEWKWRGETYAGTGSEYHLIKNQAEIESFPSSAKNGKMTPFLNLKEDEKVAILKQRFKKYCQKVYGHILNKPVTESKMSGICMKENDFYVNTVQSFRDRRYEYKGLNKKWKGKLKDAEKGGAIGPIKEAQDMVILYDSLQLAHKCILNSFYGYVMRKGARWYSMEMAGVVTLTGANIIQNATKLIERLGRPLELDTDGIWCALPGDFPENFNFATVSGKPVQVEYPCAILNVMVAEKNTNDQYHSLVDKDRRQYEESSRMSIEFEVDGPYKAMILPASLAEGKSIKKRYAVFDFKDKLVELKGFELKRRGELKLVKIFQEMIFSKFLEGTTLEECYASVASVADQWLDVLDTRGIDLTEDELLELLADSTTMSKTIEEYGNARSCAITTALRLNQFLGGDTLKYGSLNCTYVIAKKPEGLPVSERAIPATIFKADPAMRRQYLTKWCRDSFYKQQLISVRDVLDWDYYKERLGKAIQKIITIPAAMQKVTNPVPRVKHPDWLHKAIQRKNDKYRQNSLTQYLKQSNPGSGSGLPGEREGLGLTTPRRSKGLCLVGQQQQQEEEEDVRENVIEIPAGADGGDGDVAMDDAHDGDDGNEEDEEGEEGPAKAPGQGSPTSVIQGLDAEEKMSKEDYVRWLNSRKVGWRAMLERRRAQRKARLFAAPDDASHFPQPKSRNVGEFFHRQQTVAVGSQWHILRLDASPDPAVLQAWVYIQGAGMYSVPLHVPRRLYVHPAEKGCAVGTPSRFALPHCHGETSVEVTPEEGAGLKSVYGSKISALDLATLDIGCVARVEPDVQKAFKKGRRFADGVTLNELRMLTTAECPYVASQGNVGNVYLYNTLSDARGIFALMFPQTRETFVAIVSPYASGAREVSTVSLDRMLANTGSDLSMAFRVEYVRTADDAGAALSREMANFRNGYRGALMLTYEGPLGHRALTRLAPALKLVPHMRRPEQPEGGAYPLMQWQVYAAQHAVDRLIGFGGWMYEQALAAQYSHIPIGNLGENAALQIADVLFARTLKGGSRLPWWSKGGLPDMGGYESDVFLCKEHVPLLAIQKPGLFHGVSIEFKVHHLAVNALTQMADLGGETLSSGMDHDAGTDSVVRRHLTCASQTLRVLKAMCHRWLTDAMDNANPYADDLLMNFYRWVSDANSAMYDPSVHQAVRQMTNASLAALLKYIEEQNIKAVFANRGSLIIYSGKRDMASAQAFVSSLKQIVRKNPAFALLELEPSIWWQELLFLDQFNYAGLKQRVGGEGGVGAAGFGSGSDGQASTDAGADADVAVVERARPLAVQVHFDMSYYFPKILHDAFVGIISEYLLKCAEGGGGGSGEGAGGPEYVSPTQMEVEMADLATQELAEHRRKSQRISAYITDDLSDKLLRILRDAELEMEDGEAAGGGEEEDAVPCRMPRSRRRAGAPNRHAQMLSFVRMLSAALDLNANTRDEVGILRKNLLRAIQANEYSTMHGSDLPAFSLCVPDVILSRWRESRDVDLLRDDVILDYIREHPGEAEAIEDQLTDALGEALNRYAMQDLVCSRTGQMHGGHLTTHSAYGGELLLTHPKAALVEAVADYGSVADFFGFEILKETVAWCEARLIG